MADDHADEVENVQSLLDKLTQQIGVITAGAKAGSAAAVRTANGAAEKLLLEIERGLSSLNALKRNSKPSKKAQIQEDITRLKAASDKCRKGLKDANYAELMSGRKEKAETEGREKMINTTQKAVSGTAKLEQGLAVLSETEDIGVNVIDNMQQQREQLIRTRDKASDVNTLAEQAKGIVRGIQARAITNKVILSAVIVVLLGLIGVVVYFCFLRQDATPAAPAPAPTSAPV